MSKICPGCEQNKPADSFAKNNRRPDGLQVYCRACKKFYDAKHYQSNKQAQLSRNTVNRNKVRQEIINYKGEAGCRYCDEADPCCLDFHHRDGLEKEEEVSRMLCKSSRSKVWLEIAKCDIVCSNCHRKLHAGRVLSPRSSTG